MNSKTLKYAKELDNQILPDRKAIEAILKEVKDPETGLSVFELGLVKAVDYMEEQKRLIVTVDFRRRTPSCPGCLPIAWHLQGTIMDELSHLFMTYEGIESVEFREG